MLPGSYIVRIYRRGKKDPRMVVGIVEEVGVREKKGFHCIEELRLILDLPPGQPIRHPRNKKNGGNGGSGGNGRGAVNRKEAGGRGPAGSRSGGETAPARDNGGGMRRDGSRE